MIRYYSFIFLFFISVVEGLGQTISGKVVNAEDESPVVHANVFLQGSQIGTITNIDGSFQLDLRGNAFLPLVVSAIGYNTVALDVRESDKKLKIPLNEKSYEIDDIDIRPGKCAWSREKMVKVFYREFVGNTRLAGTCVIENISDVYLYYNEDTKTLHAHCKKPVVIRNKMLGYRIYFTLENFEWTRKTLRYYGYTKFEDLIVAGPEDSERIKFRRKAAYKGTLMYFLRNLYRGTLAKAGFSLLNRDGESIELSDIVLDYATKRYLCFENRVLINYGLDELKSTLQLSKSLVEVHPNGYVHPEEVEVTGYLGLFRVGDMLPYDYNDQE